MIEKLLSFIIPDEMRKMTEEEILTFFPYAKEEVLGIRNEEKHTIITITFKKKPLLIGKNASVEDCLRATEKKIQKKEQSYENKGYGSKIVDGKEIPVFSYQYIIQGKKQLGKYGLYSNGRYFLAFSYICGEDFIDFAEQKYDEFLSTVIFR